MSVILSAGRTCSSKASVGRLNILIRKRNTSHRTVSSTARARSTDSKKSDRAVPNPIPACFLRGGTSKGIFIHRKYLPSDRKDWDSIFLGIMGSPDPEHGRQLNGMGGGVSSLSKICVLGEPSDLQKAAGIDVEYTFAQVPIRDTTVDYSGNCGNLSSMIGVCAVDFGICEPKLKPGDETCGTVRSFNTNTQKVVDTAFPVSREAHNLLPILDLPQAAVAGVPGKSSRIDLEFVSPGGSRTGKLLPTGKSVNVLRSNLSPRLPTDSGAFRASLVDATNPSVFVLTEEIGRALGVDDVDFTHPAVETIMEDLRQLGAKAMGLDINAKAQPKICAIGPPKPDSNVPADLVAHAYSMGVLHKAIPMTLGLCLGVAAQIKGTIAWDIISQRNGGPPRKSSDKATTKIQHPSGVVELGAAFSKEGEVESAMVVRTGRRLMEGAVWW
ncbi:DUF453 domain-containing protein [Schizopora paradoxa]|uniref:DUF453 domain-containing protein n=1 Tax=Schizopora paradoxa TaxID=27342 RepID=A0A0H2RZE9_9AGAM|nr:DUF453 domain-containing protein [Schizopora paradoxa]